MTTRVRTLSKPLLPLWCATLVAALAGCSEAKPPEFRFNMEGINADDYRITGDEPDDEAKKDKQWVVDQYKNIATDLYAAFGTPDNPYAFPETGLDLKKLRLAAGPAASDEHGTTGGLFRVHCAHCHGVTGDGQGPTALFLNPYPRDYRRGVFKFTSTEQGRRPTLDDLKRTITNGIQGTAMPSFKLLPEDEIDALAEYVKYLSMRGELETLLFLHILDEDDVPLDRDGLFEDLMVSVNAWDEAEDMVVEPDPDTVPDTSTHAEMLASIERGKQVFRDAKNAQCIKCHGPTGLGDGGGEELFDDWNKEKIVKGVELYGLPPQELKPRNLTLGIYRGGRRPIDLYRRIFAGIKGTPMPAAGKVLKPEQIWDVINYVRSLPYPEYYDHLRAEAEGGHTDEGQVHADVSRAEEPSLSFNEAQD